MPHITLETASFYHFQRCGDILVNVQLCGCRTGQPMKMCASIRLRRNVSLGCRYLEFNLLYDRGVRFGLPQSKPQQAAVAAGPEPKPAGYVQAMESIMVSAPPLIRWSYKVVPQPDSPEERLLQVLRQPRDWV